MSKRMEITGTSSEVVINGRCYRGRSISIVGDLVVVDGETQADSVDRGPISVVVSGDCGAVRIGSGEVSVVGKVGTIDAGSGDVDITGDVGGNVTTGSGDVLCRNVSGTVKSGSGCVSVRRMGDPR